MASKSLLHKQLWVLQRLRTAAISVIPKRSFSILM